jgi:hypothetical protein
MSGALLAGRSTVKLKDKDFTPVFESIDKLKDTHSTIIDSPADYFYENSVSIVTPMLQASLGLAWEKALDTKSSLSVKIGYEFHHWFNTDSFISGDLSMHGLSLGLGYNF